MAALRVAHDIPGRLRLRLPQGADAERAAAALADEAGVLTSRWAPRTRSLLIVYDPESTTREAMREAVARELGVDAVPAAPIPPVGTQARNGAFADGVRRLFHEADVGVQRATRGLLSLGGLFPAALTAWALTEVVRGRAAPLAWSTALWYAHGLFRDYQLPPSQD